MGGEKLIHSWLSVGTVGSPPHGRGKDAGTEYTPIVEGITPAWAGKSSSVQTGYCGTTDHPRMGGEKISWFSTGCSPRGSPPRRRGKVESYVAQQEEMGITPA